MTEHEPSTADLFAQWAQDRTNSPGVTPDDLAAVHEDRTPPATPEMFGAWLDENAEPTEDLL